MSFLKNVKLGQTIRNGKFSEFTLDIPRKKSKRGSIFNSKRMSLVLKLTKIKKIKFEHLYFKEKSNTCLRSRRPMSILVMIHPVTTLYRYCIETSRITSPVPPYTTHWETGYLVQIG